MNKPDFSEYENAILESLSLLTSKRYKYIEYFDKDEYRLYRRNNLLYFSIENEKIQELEVEINNPKNSIQEYLENLSSLKSLTIYINNTKESIIDINLHIETLTNLSIYTKGNVRITVSFENLPNIYSLMIVGDSIGNKELLNIDSIKNAKSLERLEIISIPIFKIPDSIRHLNNLKDLVLRDCGLREFDDLIFEIETLEWLDLQGNKDLKIKKNIRDRLYEKLGLFNPPEHYMDEDLYSLFNEK